MTDRSMMITVPDGLYDRIQQRAASEGRSVETEVVDLLARALPDDRLSPELEAELAQLPLLDDERLWAAARSRVTDSQVRRLRSLNHKDQGDGLSAKEERARDRLVHHYERVMLVRATAAVLLKERGHDINILLQTE